MKPSNNSIAIIGDNTGAIYYVSLQVDNQNFQEPVVLRWVLPDAAADEKLIPASSVVMHEFQIGASEQPGPIEFEAHSKSTGRIVQLNGQDKFLVTPSKDKETIFIKAQTSAQNGKLGKRFIIKPKVSSPIFASSIKRI